MSEPKQTLLLILDGWGQAGNEKTNAIHAAKTPNLDRLMQEFPSCVLACTGEAVGLPGGQMGNSEVGHLNLGAGRVVDQDIMRINKSIDDGSLFENQVLDDLISRCLHNGSRLHLLGLVSDGGVHSHQRHIEALLELAARQGLEDVVVHAFLDGRDTPPTSGLEHLGRLREQMRTIGVGRIASVCGRYYAMDRDGRWDRIEAAYKAVVDGRGPTADDPVECVRKAYDSGESDEFVSPTVMTGESGSPVGRIEDGDAVFFFNFRADRARQLVRSLYEQDFQGFTRPRRPDLAGLATMTEYDASFGLPSAFPPQAITGILGQVCSERGLAQLRIAETEKYAHVTYFFNGGREEPFPGEERILVPSPRDVATYDHKPEMSLAEVADRLLEQWGQGRFTLLVCNFANLDMVGHTGDFQATVRACEAVDQAVGWINRAVLETDGRLLITADHGNADVMVDEHQERHTAHSLNPVPFVLVEGSTAGITLRQEGVLGDVAPTILDLWQMDKPAAMTGRTLVERDST
jgi:2,3-bisphosphoglycerate-independent phosphoglycerate mutase